MDTRTRASLELCEKVLKWTLRSHPPDRVVFLDGEGGLHLGLPAPFTDPAAALMLAERWCDADHGFVVEKIFGPRMHNYRAVLRRGYHVRFIAEGQSLAEALTLAVCEAARIDTKGCRDACKSQTHS